MDTFQQLGLEDHLLQAIIDLGFETPSEVQQKAIPTLLQEENDLVALAQTGTGKTAAFGFPMLQKMILIAEQLKDLFSRQPANCAYKLQTISNYMGNTAKV